MDFDPWDLANSAWSKLGEQTAEDGERRAKHHLDVMARVDEMLAQQSEATLDSSMPDDYELDTTYDSGTALDTTFDSTAADTDASSLVYVPPPSGAAGEVAAAISGFDGHPGAAFLNKVFDVPLEAPLEYMCGEMKDCESSTRPTRRRKKITITTDKATVSNKNLPVRVKKEDTSSADSSTSKDSAIVQEEDDGPPTDESMTLLDPPTHDSRINVSRCDDSTLNTLNTNNVERDTDTEDMPEPSQLPEPATKGQEEKTENLQEQEDQEVEMLVQRMVDTTKEPSADSSVQVAKDPSIFAADHNSDDLSKDPNMDSPVGMATPTSTGSPCHYMEKIEAEEASLSQMVQITASDISSQHEAIETASVSNLVPLLPQLDEEIREGVADSPRPFSLHSLSPLDSDPSSSSKMEETDTEDMLPSPSSLSGRRVGFTASTKQDFSTDLPDDDGNDSSVSGASAVSTEKNPSSFVANMLAYLTKAAADNPSLACVKANLDYGLETWQASNDACMDAIVISDDDMGGMLDVISQELKRPTPSWMAQSE